MSTLLALRVASGTAVILITAVGTAVQVQAQEKRTVPVGQETRLVTTKQALKVTAPPKNGTVRVVEEAGTFTLAYIPSAGIKEKTTDSLQYQMGSDPKSVTIAITIEPSTASTDSGQKPAPGQGNQGSTGAGPPPADPGAAAGFPPGTYDQSLKAIFVLFALAVVLESSLAVLFNWRPFVETFNSRAVRPLISFAVAFVFVRLFELDLMTKLVNVIKPANYPPNTSGQLLTALMLAGGSAAVNNVLVGLGFRQQRTPETAVPKPPPTQGWIAVSVDRRLAVGPVSVYIGPPAAAGAKPPLAAVLHRSSKRGLRYFLADPGRFPRTGGYAVAAGTVVELHLEAAAEGDQTLQKKWGPHTIAGGAIVDLHFTM
jgi:hypothetical protein